MTDAEKLVVDLNEQADLLQETQEAPGAEFDLWIAPELLREAATTISDLKAEVRIQQAYRKEADESTAYWEVKAAELSAEVKMRAESQGLTALAIDSLEAQVIALREWLDEYGQCRVCAGANADECKHWPALKSVDDPLVNALQVALAYALDTIEDCCESPPLADIKMAELRALTTDKESKDGS